MLISLYRIWKYKMNLRASFLQYRYIAIKRKLSQRLKRQKEVITIKDPINNQD